MNALMEIYCAGQRAYRANDADNPPMSLNSIGAGMWRAGYADAAEEAEADEAIAWELDD
mgnify:CR=1 FL=1